MFLRGCYAVFLLGVYAAVCLSGINNASSAAAHNAACSGVPRSRAIYRAFIRNNAGGYAQTRA